MLITKTLTQENIAGRLKNRLEVDIHLEPKQLMITVPLLICREEGITN